MSDGIIIPPTAPQPQQPATAVPEVAKVVSLPPDLPPNKIVSGEIVANDKGIVTIKTDQGLVVLQAKIDAAVGDMVSFKLQNIVQQAKPQLIAELLPNINTGVVSSSKSPLLQSPSVQPAVDNVVVRDTRPLSEFTPLQARLVSLPDVLGDEPVQVMVKSLLQLPVNNPLPPTLQEGFEKFQQLTQLMTQAKLLPAQTLQSPSNSGDLQKGLLTALQNMLQPASTGKPEALASQPGQNFIQLQTILPGQKISPDILLQVRQQLLTLLQPEQAQPQPALPTTTMPVPATSSELPSSPQELPVLPGMPQSQPATSVEKAPLYTMPAIGLVLGQQPQATSELKSASLVFMATPQGQQLIGLLSQADMVQAPDHALLPGTVLVTAFKPQTQQMLALPVVPSSAMVETLVKLAPLNLFLGDTWPALQEIVQQATALQHTHPEMMAMLQQVLPAPSPQQMPPAVLFFLSVLKNNFSGNWLSQDQLSVLDKIGKTELLKQLSQDLRQIQNSLNDTAPADSWRPLPVPLQIGDQLLRLQFFYRHPDDALSREEKEDIQDNKKRKTRFLVNVPKTHYGDIQIDGLVQEKDLEMILRTENPVSSQMESAIRSRYQAVLETTGMSGNINFQSGLNHYVRA